MRIVLKLTGKAFEPGNEQVLLKIIKILREKASTDRVVVITGGGKTARKYVELGKELGVNNAWLDLLGIEASRLNALLLAAALGELAHTPIPRSVDEALHGLSTGKVVVLGGLQPGQSTNAVSAMIAELVKADLLINATNVDGVYDKDPSKYPDAKPLKEISIRQLSEMLRSQDFRPGHYELLDAVALKVIARSRIRLVFVNAFKPETIRMAWELRKEAGTWVKYYP